MSNCVLASDKYSSYKQNIHITSCYVGLQTSLQKWRTILLSSVNPWSRSQRLTSPYQSISVSERDIKREKKNNDSAQGSSTETVMQPPSSFTPLLTRMLRYLLNGMFWSATALRRVPDEIDGAQQSHDCENQAERRFSVQKERSNFPNIKSALQTERESERMRARE